MSRVIQLLAAATAAAVSALPATAGEAYTTRIEPRGFYGATISIEQGVRVFRPLPPVRHVIVNPGGVTPLNLSYSDVRVDERRTNYNYNYNDGGAASHGGGGYGIGGGYYGGIGKGHHSLRSKVGGVPTGNHGGGHMGGGKGGHR
ncbi:MAG: hypothetical protein ABL908_10615 [Hyphomicrobium sp.]